MKPASLYRVAIAAKKCGIARSSLVSAVARGEVAVEHTGCGLPLVTLQAVRAWKQAERPGPGRPKTE